MLMLPSTPPDPQVKITQLALCTKKFLPKINLQLELHQKTSEIEPKKPGFYSKMHSLWQTDKGKEIHDKGIIGKSLGPKGET